MIDPVGFLVNETVKSMREHIIKAEQSTAQTVQRCENYLEAARIAINGLWKAYDLILVKAESCNVDDPEQVAELRTYIIQYANVDQIRPELRQAIKGISRCVDSIRKIAGRSMQLPKNKKEREETVARLVRLLRELAKHLARLESHGLEYLPAGTGIGIISLNRILGFLQDYEYQPSKHSAEGLANLVNEIRRDRSKDELWVITDQIVDMINDLHEAF